MAACTSRRHQAQRFERSEAVARQDRERQIGSLSSKLRDDRTLENAARKQWAQMCRSISLGRAAPKGAPDLWLEVQANARLRGAAENPRRLGHPDPWRGGRDPHRAGRDQARLPLPGGSTSSPDRPRPGQPRRADRRAVHRIEPRDGISAQGQAVFPETGNSPGQVTVLSSSISASGERLLISLRVKAKETKSWFGLGAEATVHIWGKPALDQQKPDHAAHRHLARRALGGSLRTVGHRRARGDPLSAEGAGRQRRGRSQAIRRRARARRSTPRSPTSRSRPTASRSKPPSPDCLTGIEFDSKNLRVIGEAEGTARALVRKIALQ